MKQDFHVKVSHDVLKWARESLAMTRTHASQQLKLNLRRLDQLEGGSRSPSLDELKSMSKVYKRTIATLLLKKPPEEKPLPKDCRTVNSSEIGNFHERTILAVRKARALAQSLLELRNEMNVTVKPFQIQSIISDDPNLIARKCRRLLQIGQLKSIRDNNQALDAYIELVESCGIAVFQLSLTQDNLRGFSITDDVLPTIVIKKGGEQSTTKIFTLFHELGHIILNEGGLCDISLNVDAPKIEKWCNAFAAELLLPTEELLQNSVVQDHISRKAITWQRKDLEEIGKHFHVGPLVVLRRLLSNKLTSKEFYAEKHITWNRPQFGRSLHPEGRNLPKETIKERGRGYLSLAFKAFDQNRIGIKDLSNLLGISINYIPRTRQLLSV